jgi:hypothetical protein
MISFFYYDALITANVIAQQTQNLEVLGSILLFENLFFVSVTHKKCHIQICSTFNTVYLLHTHARTQNQRKNVETHGDEYDHKNTLGY